MTVLLSGDTLEGSQGLYGVSFICTCTHRHMGPRARTHSHTHSHNMHTKTSPTWLLCPASACPPALSCDLLPLRAPHEAGTRAVAHRAAEKFPLQRRDVGAVASVALKAGSLLASSQLDPQRGCCTQGLVPPPPLESSPRPLSSLTTGLQRGAREGRGCCMLLLFPAGKETGRCGHSLPHSLTSLGGSLQARKGGGGPWKGWCS